MQHTHELRERYQVALLQGDGKAAAQVVTDGLAGGVGAADLYLEVFIPAQVEVGEQWHRGELNIAQEHQATQITLTQMARLRLAAPVTPSSGRHAVVTAVEHEHHFLGARVLADFLLMDGWVVDFLGADTPTSDLVAFVEQREPHLVVLSVTMTANLASAQHAVDALRQRAPAAKILLGGSGCLDATVADIGADAVAPAAWETLQRARELVPVRKGLGSLDETLERLGQQVRTQRQARHWSQQQLGQAAGLDRSYVNAVEHGKQNLTLGAVLKLADALGVPLDELLSVHYG